jgi:hypothetical protein
MTSKVPTFKAALLERLIADTDFAAVQVSQGHPHPDRLKTKLLIIGDATAIGRDYAVGLVAANEKHAVEIIISVVGPIQTAQQALLQAAYDIADDFDDNIIAWRSTAYDSVVNLVMPDAWSDHEAITKDVREASLTTKIIVTSRI